MESQGRRQEAIIALEELAQQPNDNPPSDRVFYRLAWLYKDAGQSDAAARTFKLLANDHPNSELYSDALLRSAQLQMEQNEDVAATESIDRLLATPDQSDSNTRPHAMLIRAKLHARENRWQEALDVLEQLELDYCQTEFSTEITYWLAEAHFRTDSFDTASHLFARLSADPRNAVKPDWQALVPLRRAQLLATQLKWTQAAQMAQLCSKQVPRVQTSLRS